VGGDVCPERANVSRTTAVPAAVWVAGPSASTFRVREEKTCRFLMLGDKRVPLEGVPTMPTSRRRTLVALSAVLSAGIGGCIGGGADGSDATPETTDRPDATATPDEEPEPAALEATDLALDAARVHDRYTRRVDDLQLLVARWVRTPTATVVDPDDGSRREIRADREAFVQLQTTATPRPGAEGVPGLDAWPPRRNAELTSPDEWPLCDAATGARTDPLTDLPDGTPLTWIDDSAEHPMFPTTLGYPTYGPPAPLTYDTDFDPGDGVVVLDVSPHVDPDAAPRYLHL
jgi:hypothetical protein